MPCKTLEELWNKGSLCADIDPGRGIYRILVPIGMKVSFLGEIKNHPGDAYPVAALQKKWAKYKDTSDGNVLYIGKANGTKGLQQRLRQYMRYGFDAGNNHRGGRAIFQIAEFENLLCEFEACANCEEREHQLLREFHAKHGTYPVANWRG